jgi:hypothetical protein
MAARDSGKIEKPGVFMLSSGGACSICNNEWDQYGMKRNNGNEEGKNSVFNNCREN